MAYTLTAVTDGWNNTTTQHETYIRKLSPHKARGASNRNVLIDDQDESSMLLASSWCAMRAFFSPPFTMSHPSSVRSGAVATAPPQINHRSSLLIIDVVDDDVVDELIVGAHHHSAR